MDQESSDLLDQLRQDALRLADRFQLQFRGLAAEHPRVKSRYGVCYQDGLIKIRLRHVKSGKPLKYSSLIDTLCHEMAHLRHFNHGPEFKALFLRLLAWARSEGIYQPGPQDSPRRPTPWIDERSRAQGSLKVPRRNGVPVFPTEPEGRGQILPLPWERTSSTGRNAEEPPVGMPAAVPSAVVAPSPAAVPSPAPAPSPRTARSPVVAVAPAVAPASAPARERHPAPRQLSLF